MHEKQPGMKGTKFIVLRSFKVLNKTKHRFIALLVLSLRFKVLAIACFPEFSASGLHIALHQ